MGRTVFGSTVPAITTVTRKGHQISVLFVLFPVTRFVKIYTRALKQAMVTCAQIEQTAAAAAGRPPSPVPPVADGVHLD